MTTELTGDFEVGEEELDWDVFLPDPDEAEIAAEAAALEDEAALDLDDSDIDWEAALNENTEPENGARAGAAYDRIVDMVRRSFEEPETEATAQAEAASEAYPDAETEAEIDLAAVAASETLDAVTPEPDVAETAPRADVVAQYEPEEDALVELMPTDEREPIDPAFVFVPDPEFEPMADMEPEETDAAPLQSAALFAPDPGPEPGPEVHPEPELEHFPPRAEPAATAVAAAMWTVDPEPSTPSEPDATWTPRLPVEDPDDLGEPEPTLEFFDADEESGGEEAIAGKKPRGRVFTATLILACLFLVVVAAAVAVRALHRPTPAPPPAHAAAPSHTTPPVAPSPSAARIQSATDAVDSATTAASVGLTSLSAFPTPTNVEAVINPYISSLQLYEAVLTGTKVPAAARPAETSAVAQLRQDLTFLDTIDGLPPDQLGAYLVHFDTNATRLQTTLSTLEQNLRTTTP